KLKAHPRNPDALYQQNHCGIYRAGFTAEKWEDISDRGGDGVFDTGISAKTSSAGRRRSWLRDGAFLDCHRVTRAAEVASERPWLVADPRDSSADWRVRSQAQGPSEKSRRALPAESLRNLSRRFYRGEVGRHFGPRRRRHLRHRNQCKDFERGAAEQLAAGWRFFGLPPRKLAPEKWRVNVPGTTAQRALGDRWRNSDTPASNETL
ncbi:MAG TPA: hypothetical protein VJN42_07355, partial [Candidatus Acidoferrum sp.]|nr:hypothetical protein [Candidatus Acidoferrum sp.]